MHFEGFSGQDLPAAEQSPVEFGRAGQDAGKSELASQHLDERDNGVVGLELVQRGGEIGGFCSCVSDISKPRRANAVLFEPLDNGGGRRAPLDLSACIVKQGFGALIVARLSFVCRQCLPLGVVGARHLTSFARDRPSARARQILKPSSLSSATRASTAQRKRTKSAARLSADTWHLRPYIWSNHIRP